MERPIRIAVSPLDAAECWERLKSTDVGRVGITVEALPVILPVLYCVVDHSIVFRSETGTRLAAATRNSVIAFEADDYSKATHDGWSVVVQGIARLATEPAEVAFLSTLPLASVAGRDDRADDFVVLSAARVSGRRIGSIDRR